MRGRAALTAGWERPIEPDRLHAVRPARAVHLPRAASGDDGRRIRKIDPETRAHLYQLELTMLETEAEILNIYARFGFSKQGRNKQRQRILEERGV